MKSREKQNTTDGKVSQKREVGALRGGGNFSIGIDIGSISSDVVVVDDNFHLIFKDYQRTRGRPLETALGQLRKIYQQINPSNVVFSAVTGSSGRFLSKLADLPFINEVTAQAEGVCKLHPELRKGSIIEMGGQDSKLIVISSDGQRREISDFILNSGCAAGTGSFLDQQADRLGINIEDEFGELALTSRNVPRMAGRCSVFAKSDMIHLQQQATPNCDIIAGLCQALASNLKSNLGRGRGFVKPIVFTGGVAANVGVVKAIESVFELKEGELIVPVEHFFTGAVGAVLAGRRKHSAKKGGSVDLSAVEDYLENRGTALESAPRLEKLDKPSTPVPKSIVHSELLETAAEPIDAYLGVDVGSISTNVAVVDEQDRVLSKAYLMTAGQPLEAVKKGLDMVGKEVSGKVNILGAATTGSGRYLTGDFIGADVVINEITAQAAGSAIVNPEVDTIFEIGGQDSKYISLENGVVVDFEMNHACAAGTGSFLEEQSQRLGFSIEEDFARLALESESPIKLGERCTVFMESDLLSYQQQGAQTNDLVAGLSYSIVANYLNRVVGRRKIGDNICFQGGTAFNKAVWSAFEKVTGKPIVVPDHHEVTGAIGAAKIAARNIMKKEQQAGHKVESTFRGFENLVKIEYKVESFTCEHCPNHCKIKKVELPGSKPLYYGSRCDRYNIQKKKDKGRGFGAFNYRREKILEHSRLKGKRGNIGAQKGKVGIPFALVFRELLPLFSRFFQSLGFEVVLSGETHKEIIRKGLENVTASTCFPVKIAYGHVAELLEKDVDFIFLPSIVSMIEYFPKNRHKQLCPYVQSLPYQIKTAFEGQFGSKEILTCPLRFGNGERLMRKSFMNLGKRVGVSKQAVLKALKEGIEAQQSFQRDLVNKGKEILRRTESGQRLFVLVSRPYNGCDEGINLELPKKLGELGADVIPMDMLELGDTPLSDEYLHQGIYWSYGQKILRTAEVIKRDERLFGIYLSNFSCGPDSFLMTFFKDLMEQKPCLQLEIDEHSADAGVITRLEAFLESLKHYHPEKEQLVKYPKTREHSISKNRKLYIPYMGDCSYGFAACFRAYGQPSEVVPLADESALLQGRQFTTGKECLPCVITTGEMLKLANSNGFQPEKSAFFMPGASGPCRFGMYSSMLRIIFRYAGIKDVQVIAPNQDSDFYQKLMDSVDGSGGFAFTKAMWIAVVGIDLLRKLILRIRPFAVDRNEAQRVYDRCLKLWIEGIEARKSLFESIELMDSIGSEFEDIGLDHQVRKPLVGVVGEIYVRSHPFANMNIIEKLEALGAGCDLASLSEWVYYTNFTRREMAKRNSEFRNRFTNVLQNHIQHRFEKKLAKPLERRFGRLAEPPIEEVIEMAKPYMHHSFEGEAILTVGKTIEYYHQGFGGVVNVMPFSCMPSTVVATQTMRVSADCGDMPILNVDFDGQENPGLETRLEAFVEQIRHRESITSASELIKSAKCL